MCIQAGQLFQYHKTKMFSLDEVMNHSYHALISAKPENQQHDSNTTQNQLLEGATGMPGGSRTQDNRVSKGKLESTDQAKDDPSLSIRQRLFQNLMSESICAGEERDKQNANKFDSQRCVTHVSNPCDNSSQIVLLNVPTFITVTSIEQSVCGKEVPPSC